MSNSYNAMLFFWLQPEEATFWLQPEEVTVINMNDTNETVSMSMKINSEYLDSFMKATTLSKTVSIILLNEMSVLVEYKITEAEAEEAAEMRYVRFYFPPASGDYKCARGPLSYQYYLYYPIMMVLPENC